MSGVAGTTLLTLALIAGSATSAAAYEPAAADSAKAATTAVVPDVLKPPAGHVSTAVLAAVGVQVYQCTAGAWTFVEPAATLAGYARRPRGPHTAIHFRGPSWQSPLDGSVVQARAAASSPVTGAIPELLLEATTTRGAGIFGQVTYIQRLNTRGGVAPAGACTDGQTAGVPYRADYHFFAAATA